MRVIIWGLLVFVVGFGLVILSKQNHKTETVNNESKLQKPTVNKLFERNGEISILPISSRVITITQPVPEILTYSFDNESKPILTDFKTLTKWQLNQVFFLNENQGFVVGNHGTLLKTLDGGKSWTIIPEFTDFDLIQVSFSDESKGFVGARFGKRNSETGDDAWQVKIFHTIDGGNTWSQVYSGEKERDIYKIVYSKNGTAFTSVDGKKLTYFSSTSTKWDLVKDFNSAISGLDFASDGIGWIVNQKGEFWTSKDNGLTWRTPENIPDFVKSEKWWSVSFNSLGNGVATSEKGNILYTKDNGLNWIKIEVNKDEPLRFVSLEKNFGVILGSKNIYRIDF
jgi:photosystem II stability/assembly factor-like uncharacterized protein